jgi:hypothetical protein
MVKAYLLRHHWGIIQGVAAVYCGVFATLDRFYPRVPASPAAAPLHPGGAGMTPSYAMPFWLWVGILALCASVAIPAIIRMFRKRPAPVEVDSVAPTIAPPSLASTGKELRGEITALMGDLYGYLAHHRQSLVPEPFDLKVTGLEDEVEDHEIVATFIPQFGDRLKRVQESLANLGMVGETVGTMTGEPTILERGASDAEDIHDIIKALKNVVVHIDSRFGTYRRAKIESQPSLASPAGPVIEAKLLRPGKFIEREPMDDFTIHVYETVTSNPMPATPHDCLADIHLVNTSEHLTTIQRFEAEAEIDGNWIPLKPSSLSPYFLDSAPLFDLWEDVKRVPLQRGVGHHGWFAFEILAKAKEPPPKLHLFVVDALGTRHTVTVPDFNNQDDGKITHRPTNTGS